MKSLNKTIVKVFFICLLIEIIITVLMVSKFSLLLVISYALPTSIFLILILIYINKVVVSPMTDINEGTKNIISGNLKYRINTSNEYETGRLIKSFNYMIEELEKKEIEYKDVELKKKVFIDSLSHDIKTPLAVISAYNEGISDGLITKEEMPKITEDIQNKILDIKTYINELSYIYEKETHINRKLIKVEIFCDTLSKDIDLINSTLPDKINFNCKLVNSDENIKIDEFQVKRAINNLLKNMIEYRYKFSEVTCIADNYSIKLIFKNDIDPLTSIDIDKIYDLYYTNNKNTYKEHIGIGLYIVKKAVEDNDLLINTHINKDLFNICIEIPFV